MKASMGATKKKKEIVARLIIERARKGTTPICRADWFLSLANEYFNCLDERPSP
jgi:hypothetical protein